MEGNTLLWIGGIVIFTAAGYVIVRNAIDEKKAKEVFLKNNDAFEDLYDNLVSNKIDVNEWSRRIVNINNPGLLRVWKKVISTKQESLAINWRNKLLKWGVQLITMKGILEPKAAFFKNINNFSSILNSLVDGTFDKIKWSEHIVGTNEKKLVALWQKYITKFKDTSLLCSAWKKQLEAWGLRCDTCKSFTYLKNRYDSLYEAENGEPMAENIKYQVITPCWILTSENEDGIVSKNIILKGKTKLQS